MRIGERAEGHGTLGGETLRVISRGMDEQVSCVHTVEYHAAVRRRELPFYVTAGMNLTDSC